jgi:hypothetical protein
MIQCYCGHRTKINYYIHTLGGNNIARKRLLVLNNALISVSEVGTSPYRMISSTHFVVSSALVLMSLCGWPNSRE